MATRKPPTTTTRKSPAKTKQSGPANPEARAELSPEEVYRLIQEAAYFKAKARDFSPGREVQDWVEAEAEIRHRLAGRA